MVSSYTRDYLPTFKIPDVYLRGKGGVAYRDDDLVEYDLDNDDEDWLEAFNRHQDSRLSDTKFERMLWKLELAWAESAEATLTPAERTNASSLASITHLPKAAAIAMLRKAVGARDMILEAVYEYWARKRKAWGKPIMRRLQAPTPASDTNPFNVFRPREKPNRPLTRRRRENSQECQEKLRVLRDNILRALELSELLMIREQKKHDIMLVDMIMQRCQVALHHQPPSMHDTIRAAAAARMAEVKAKGSQHDARLAAYLEASAAALQGLGGAPNLDEPIRHSLLCKRRRLELEAIVGGTVTNADPVTRLPPPLPAPDPEPLYAYQCVLQELLGPALGGGLPGAQQPAAGGSSAASAQDDKRLGSMPAAAAEAVASGRTRAFVGRGGRIVVARVDALTLEAFEPHPPAPQPKPSAPAGSSEAAGMSTPGPAHAQPAQAGGDGTPGGAAGKRGAGQVVMDALLFGWQQPRAEPWAATLDLALLPDYIDRAPYLEQRKRKLAVEDYREQLAAAAANIQAAQTAQQAAAGTSTTPGAAPAPIQPVPPPPLRPTPFAPFSRRLATLPLAGQTAGALAGTPSPAVASKAGA